MVVVVVVVAFRAEEMLVVTSAVLLVEGLRLVVVVPVLSGWDRAVAKAIPTVVSLLVDTEKKAEF